MNKKMSKKLEKTPDEHFKYSFETFVSTFLSSYFIVSIINLLAHIDDEVFYTSLDFLQKDANRADFALHCFAIAGIMFMLTLSLIALPKYNIVPNTLVSSAILLAFLLMYKSNTSEYYMYFAVMLVLAIVLLYAVEKKCFSFIKGEFNSGIMWGAVGIIAVGFASFTAIIGVYRYLTYSTPNFDFGLFCNMFYNMAESGIPNVTSERDMLLSHFAVHFSPIYYLMLPFYAIFPSPITLQILQVVVIYVGIIPIVLIARHKNLSSKMTLVIAAIYAAYPALSAGCFYDLHENCFLVTLLLWVFYFFEKEKYIPMSIFAVLTLLVKEDAFIYLIIFAIFVLISEKKWKVAIPMAVVPLIYFLVVSTLMEQYGTGIMSGRYGNMIFDSEDGLIGVVKTIILNPGYALSQIFVSSANDTAKLKYLIQLLMPLAFLPFATKKISRFILLVPVLLNILTMYKYQPDITFQYSFGISAFLFYAALINLSELNVKPKSYLSGLALVAAVLMFTIVVIPKSTTYMKKYEDNKDLIERIDYALEEVLPENASVSCSSFFLAHISDRDVIYQDSYHKDGKEYKTDTEYLVLDMRPGYANTSKEIAEIYKSKGYVEYYSDEDAILILVDENFNK